MPVEGGRYIANPSVARGFAKSRGVHEPAAPKVKPERNEMETETPGGESEGEHNHPPAHKVEIHRMDGNKFHVLGHHEDGSHAKTFEGHQAAFNHAKGCMNCNQGEDSTMNQGGGDSEPGQSWMGDM